MATKKAIKSAPAKKVGRPPVNPTASEEKTKGKPVVIFLPKKLHARVRLGCIALSTNASTVVRELLEEWTKKKAKAIASVINMDSDEDEDIEEEEEVEEEEDEEEDEDEEEEEEED